MRAHFGLGDVHGNIADEDCARVALLRALFCGDVFCLPVPGLALGLAAFQKGLMYEF